MIRNVAFIGLGIMGSAMAANLVKRGFAVTGYVRRKEKIPKLSWLEIPLVTSIAEACCGADAVITMVGGPADVEQIYLSEGGIMDSAPKGALLCDMTSSSPSLARKLHKECKARGLRALDAPVSGGDKGAKAGTLSIFCGGDEDDFLYAKQMLEAMGSNIVLEGGPGAGQDTKLAAQIIVAGQLAGICEGFAYAMERRLDLEKFAASLKGSAADSAGLALYAGRIVEGDRQPGGALSYLVKDLKNALSELKGSGIDLNVTSEALSNYQAMQDRGDGGLGTQALAFEYARRRGSGVKERPSAPATNSIEKEVKQ
jgi:3-hydroxyisobutyrate dehydrogenase-like beta-hydroxyacid dehydrogenase